MELLFFPFVGFVVGIIVGFSGMGGGALMTPILIMSGIPAQVAITTDLVFAGITKSLNAILRKKIVKVNKKILSCMILGSITGVCITNLLLKKHISSLDNFDFILTVSLGCILTATIFALTILTYIPRNNVSGFINENDINNSISRSRMFLTFMTAIVIGGSVSLTSVGSGVLGVVALFWLYPKLSVNHVVSIDICYAIPLTILSWISLSLIGHKSDYILLGQLLIGSVIGTIVSLSLIKKLNERTARILMIILMSIITVKLFHKAFS